MSASLFQPPEAEPLPLIRVTGSPLKGVPAKAVEWTPRTFRAGLIARNIGVYPLYNKDGRKVMTTLLQVGFFHPYLRLLSDSMNCFINNEIISLLFRTEYRIEFNLKISFTALLPNLNFASQIALEHMYHIDFFFHR